VVAWKKQKYTTTVGYGREHMEAEEAVDFCKILSS
jgi:hypothetical protein